MISKVVITEMTNDKPSQQLGWPVKQRWGWVKTPEGGRVFRSLILIDTPYDLANAAPQASDPSTTFKIKGQRLLVQTNAMVQRIQFGVSGPEIELKNWPPRPSFIDENCAELNLTLTPVGAKAPFLLATSCNQTESKTSVHLTFPSDVELLESTLFETLGKGENWRVYDIKKISMADKEIGRFQFRFKKKTYTYFLGSNKVDSSESPQLDPDVAFGIGYGQFKLSSSDVNINDAKPIARIQYLPHVFWRGFGVGANAEAAVATSTSSRSISYVQVLGYAFWQARLSSSFELQPRAYFVVTNQSSSSGVGYQTNNAGAGAYLAWKIGQRFLVRLEGMTQSIGSKVIKSHQQVDLSVLSLGSNQRWGWGAGSQMQSCSVVDSENNVRKFDQILFYGLVAF